MTALWIILGIVALIALWLMGTYNNLVAGMFGFTTQPMFEVADRATVSKAPTVNF